MECPQCEGFQLLGVIASVFGGEEINNIVKRFTEVTREGALINWKGRSNRKLWNRRKSKSGIDGGIVVLEGRASRRGGRSHEEEPKDRR